MNTQRSVATYSDPSLPSTRISAVATATPNTSFTQAEILDILSITDIRARSVFLNSGIERRYLTRPVCDGMRETQETLLAKHCHCGVALGSDAMRKCVGRVGATLRDISYLCCVTTTGFLTPSFSALLAQENGLRADCSRLDIVGMGCNAGLNGLHSVVAWSQMHPGQLAVMICIEVCSAAYVIDDNIETAVVNSLFGDGSAALVVVTSDDSSSQRPAVLQFSSYLIPETLNAMAFRWSESHGKYRFTLSKDVPYVVGAHAPHVVASLLNRACLRQSDISHWIIHAGGKKVIDSMKVNLGLSSHDMRHTLSVLRDYGNLSSGSFLFSFERLLAERNFTPGEYGVMLTMGPGSTIEAALLKW